MESKQVTCRECKKDFKANISSRLVRCKPCRDIRRNRANESFKLRKCLDCDYEMKLTPSSSKKYCPECAGNRKRESNKRTKQNNKMTNCTIDKKIDMDIDEICVYNPITNRFMMLDNPVRMKIKDVKKFNTLRSEMKKDKFDKKVREDAAEDVEFQIYANDYLIKKYYADRTALQYLAQKHEKMFEEQQKNLLTDKNENDSDYTTSDEEPEIVDSVKNEIQEIKLQNLSDIPAS